MTQLPKPISVTKDRVVLSRSSWDAVIEALEDAEDRAALRSSAARRAAGKDDGLPIALYWRIRQGEHPIRVWRAHRKLSLNALAEKAVVARSYLSEIETRKKPGSVAALQRIASVLGVDLNELVPTKNQKARR